MGDGETFNLIPVPLRLSADANYATEQITSWFPGLRAYLRISESQQITAMYRTISRRLMAGWNAL